MTTDDTTGSKILSSSSSLLSSSLITVATCTLNQWALDFDGNAQRIIQSCDEAKALGANYRLGPELELSGYGCEDHFYEYDTFIHCWESLIHLINVGKCTDNLICDFGMPVLFHGIRYNCRVICYNRQILCIRPKTALADNGNYRESRYFTAYKPSSSSSSNSTSSMNEQLLLPTFVQNALEYHSPTSTNRYVPFGLSFIEFQDGITIGCESCEELWTPQATHIQLSLQGVELISNGSGSYHELRKLNTRLELIVNATKKCGGVYMYSNQRGCDGGRCYFDGGSIIVCNGQILAQANQFSIDEVQVITATIDLNDVRSYRASLPSFGIQAAAIASTASNSSSSGLTTRIPKITCPTPAVSVSTNKQRHKYPSIPIQLKYHTPEEECCLGPACWLWDYLRRSGASGYLLPLSGGADSSSVATIVGAMCDLVTKACHDNPKGSIANEVRRICHKNITKDDTNETEDDKYWIPKSSQELASDIFTTVYMGTVNSSQATNSRAKRLGECIGSYHLTIPIDLITTAIIKVFTLVTSKTPQFEINGGTIQEDLALQNIQARIRMVIAYLFAQLIPWTVNKKGFLLVLASANVDEGLRGYMTKYDCSSADLNPIGAISKGDLKRMLLWASTNYQWPVLSEIAGAPPTAELRPMTTTMNNNEQNKVASTTANNEGKDNDTKEGGGEGAKEGEGEGEEGGEHSQLDEDEMGMTYKELGLYGTLRKQFRCGPVSMFQKLVITWKDTLRPTVVAEKVQRFFTYYSINRHKMCTITPAYHAESYSPDDNRFDLRPFLYNTKWTRQFRVMNELATSMEEQQKQQENETKDK